MRFREHVFDLFTGINVPLGHIVRAHLGLPLGFESATFSHRLHDRKRKTVVKSVADEVEHDTVARTYDLGNRTNAVADEVLRIAKPYVGAVRQARNLQKVGEVARLRLDENLLHEPGAELGQTERADRAVDILGRNAERLSRFEQFVHRAVIHLHVHDAGFCVLFEHLILGRHIVSELVQFQDSIVQIRELEVCGDDIGIRVVGGVLHGGKIVHAVLLGHNDDAAGVLTRSALDADAALDKTIHIRAAERNALAVEIFRDKAERRFGRHGTDGTCAEHVFTAEQFLGVFMYLTLHIAREVQVDIGGFVAVESEEGFKRDIVTVARHRFAANRADLVGQVKARTDRAVGEELAVLTLCAAVMRRQRIYLGDTRHRSNERRADRTARADKIPLALAVRNQLLRDHVEHGETVLDDGLQLFGKALFHDFGQVVAVERTRALPAHALQVFLRTVHVRRVRALRDRADLLEHVAD